MSPQTKFCVSVCEMEKPFFVISWLSSSGEIAAFGRKWPVDTANINVYLLISRYPSVINSAVIEANVVLVCAHKTDVRLNQNWNVCGRKISYEWPKDRTISCMTGCHHYVWKRSLKKSQSRRMIFVLSLCGQTGTSNWGFHSF